MPLQSGFWWMFMNFSESQKFWDLGQPCHGFLVAFPGKRDSSVSNLWMAVHYYSWIFMVQALKHGSLNVPIEHHPTIRYMVYNGYFFRWLSNIPKMGQLPTPVKNYIFWPYSILYQPSDFSVLSNWMTMILQGGLQCVWQDTFTILLHRLCVIVPR